MKKSSISMLILTQLVVSNMAFSNISIDHAYYTDFAGTQHQVKQALKKLCDGQELCAFKVQPCEPDQTWWGSWFGNPTNVAKKGDNWGDFFKFDSSNLTLDYKCTGRLWNGPQRQTWNYSGKYIEMNCSGKTFPSLNSMLETTTKIGNLMLIVKRLCVGECIIN